MSTNIHLAVLTTLMACRAWGARRDCAEGQIEAHVGVVIDSSRPKSSAEQTPNFDKSLGVEETVRQQTQACSVLSTSCDGIVAVDHADKREDESRALLIDLYSALVSEHDGRNAKTLTGRFLSGFQNLWHRVGSYTQASYAANAQQILEMENASPWLLYGRLAGAYSAQILTDTERGAIISYLERLKGRYRWLPTMRDSLTLDAAEELAAQADEETMGLLCRKLASVCTEVRKRLPRWVTVPSGLQLEALKMKALANRDQTLPQETDNAFQLAWESSGAFGVEVVCCDGAGERCNLMSRTAFAEAVIGDDPLMSRWGPEAFANGCPGTRLYGESVADWLSGTISVAAQKNGLWYQLTGTIPATSDWLTRTTPVAGVTSSCARGRRRLCRLYPADFD